MKAEELMVGNLIYKNLTTLNEVFEIKKGFEIDSADDTLVNYQPIPVSEERLLRFGFKEVLYNNFTITYGEPNEPGTFIFHVNLQENKIRIEKIIQRFGKSENIHIPYRGYTKEAN